MFPTCRTVNEKNARVYLLAKLPSIIIVCSIAAIAFFHVAASFSVQVITSACCRLCVEMEIGMGKARGTLRPCHESRGGELARQQVGSLPEAKATKEGAPGSRASSYRAIVGPFMKTNVTG
jgi:hypothetical protein